MLRKSPIKKKPGIGLRARKTPLRGTKKRKSIRDSSGKVWGLERADKAISKFIRERDGKCLFPGCEVTDFARLQCSHYYGRAKNSTRFLPANLISLCRKHHYGDKLIGWEFAKQRLEVHGRDGEYTAFMKHFLREKWVVLELRAKTSMKRTEAIQELMELLITPEYKPDVPDT